ncbi:MAG: amidohydrolase family protein [Planctomycetota bacterium]|nr:amidohydrolase family protein [Planctomycetota bacterium]
MNKTALGRSLASALGILVFSGISMAQQTAGTKPEVGVLEHKSDVVAIQNATVVPEPGKSLEKATILVRDGKIVEVGTNVTVPADAEIIDMAGKTIYAGFVDAGIELEVPPSDAGKGTPHWNSEITPERSMAQVITANEATMSKLRKAGITAALVAPRDGIIKGTSAVLLTSNESAIDALLKSDVAMHVRLTVARRGRDAYPSSPMGAVAIARQSFLDAQWHTQAWQTYRSQIGIEKPEANAALEALSKHMADGKLVMFDALNEQYAMRADSFGKEFGLNVILKGSGQEYQLLDKIAKLNRTIIVPMNFPKPPNVATADAALDTELEELTHWELAPENPGRLAKAGVKIVLTSNGLSDPSELIPQIRKAIARGLDKTVAIQAITTAPAALLGVENECGSIKPGAWANLIVTNGDLWEEKSKIEEVWVRGTRPAGSYKVETAVDGKWQVTVSQAVGMEARPKELFLTLAESTKKISGSLSLLDAPKPEPAKEKEAAASDKPADKSDAKPETTTDKPVPADAPPLEAAKPEAPKTDAADKPADKPAEPAAEAKKPDDKKKGEKAEKGIAKLKAPRWEDRTLSATFPANSLIEGETGVGYLSVALLPAPNADSKEMLIGTIQWPNGQQQLISAVRKAEEVKDVAKEKDADDKSKEKKDEKKSPKPVLSTAMYPPGILGKNGLPEQPDYVVFQKTTIWTSGPEGVLKDADLIVHKGLIHKIGKDLAVPAGATVIDASKWQLSPGLIDCHSHMATDSGINESTQAVTAEVRIGDFIDAGDITIYRQLAGGLTTANVLHGSANPIGGQNQVVKLRWGGTYEDLKFEDAPAGIKFALGENVKQSNWEGPKTRYPQSRMGVEQLIRDRFNSAREYDAAWKGWNRERSGLPPRRDLELEAIAEILRGERWIHCHSYRQDEILGLLRLLEENNVKIGSLQHILEGYKVADAIAKHGGTASTFSDWWAFKLEVYDAIPYNGAILHKQGVNVSFNSDDAELGRHMNHEAAKAIKYGGVEPTEALKFVTINPAMQLRIDSKVGSLEVGKHADIAIWTGSPLSTLARCEQTWIDGRKYFDRQSDAEMRKRDFALHKSLVQKILDSGEASGEKSSLADDPSRLWPNHDEFCHHHHDESDHAEHEHE